MAGFDNLSPQAVISAVEAAFGRPLLPMVTPYPSYVNRVYGISDADETPYVTKFYRPGRWSAETIEEEHRFIRELAAEEIPIASPLEDEDGETLAEVTLRTEEGDEDFFFALFPKRSGRLFDAESDEAWIRIGRLCGRIHAVGSRTEAPHRPYISPGAGSRAQIEEILAHEVIPGDLSGEFTDIARGLLERIAPLFEGVPVIRVHGDLHRGNILDRGDEGLLLIDLDDMASGPAMQDLWLLLPGRRGEVGREIALLAEGYEDFRPFPWDQTALIEPLRFMRMIHFIAWCARQRFDRDFKTHFPDWGSRSWWIKEMEDLRDQASAIEAAGN
jgi:Ser/Thr protein kinase RdoA (MazF antagonist)